MAKKINTIGDLAAMIQRTTASKEDLVELKTELKGDIAQMRTEMATKTEMRDGFHAVNRRIDLLREDISDLPDIREEVKELGERLTRVERKVGAAR